MFLSMQIARSQILLKDMVLRRIILGFFIGALLIMGLYHVMLFLCRRKDWSYLFFTVFCLSGTIRFALETNGLADILLPGGMGIALVRLLLTCMILQMAALVCFTHAVFELPLNNKARNVSYIVFTVIPLITIFFPYGTLNLRLGFLGFIPLVIALVSAAKSKRLKENPYNILFLVSLGLFIFLGPFFQLVLNDTVYMSPVAHNLFIVLVQCIVLSQGYAAAKSEAEELAERNEFLDGLSRLKTEYLANISHEMKTPLTVISVHVQQANELFESGGQDPDTLTIRHSLTRAQEEIMRVARMTENALRLSVMQESRQRMKPLDIAALLSNTAETYRLMLEMRGNRLAVNIAEGLPYVYGDADLLVQVTANLLSNANAHAKGGEITLTALPENKFVKITIADNGLGISPEFQPHIFDRGTTDTGSTGFGLSICREIITSHKGTIGIESKPGKGTVVSFSIPLCRDGASSGGGKNA
jgi:signal transduction histidine kinase